MKTRFFSILVAITVVLFPMLPACAIVLDGYNWNNEYETNKNKPFKLIDNAIESGNDVSWAQAYVKTEDTLCYIIFNVLCDGVIKNSKAGVIIIVEDETLKADMTQEQYDGYDRNKFDFAYVGELKDQGFSIEVRINFKNGLEDGKKLLIHLMDSKGEQSAVKEMTLRKTEPTTIATTQKTTKSTTEKTTKEKTTKPTTEKTTKPTTTKTEAAKQTTAPETRTKREITHRAVTTTIKAQTSDSANENSSKTTKAASTKFKAKQNGNKAAVTKQQSTSERRTGRYAGTVTYSYITDEYTTAAETAAGSSKSKKKIAALVSATLVIAACVFGTISKKDKSGEDEKSERS